MIHVNIGITMKSALPDTPPSPKRRYGGVLPEERQRLRRAKLIEGAIEVFGTKGFHAATVRCPSSSWPPTPTCASSSWR